MSKIIVQQNEEVITGEIKELVHESIGETLNEQERKVHSAAKYEHSEAKAETDN